MAWAISNGISKNEKQYLEAIGFPRTNISNLRKGLNRFTVDQIEAACRHTGANANWILGLEKNMHRNPGKDAISMLKEAVIAVEEELKGRGPVSKIVSTAQKKSQKTSSLKK